MAYNPHSYLKKAAIAVEGVTGISAAGVFDPTEFDAKTTPVGADLAIIQDTEDSDAPKGVTITNLSAVVTALAQRLADDAGSLFYIAKEVDFGVATAVDEKITDAAPAKGALVGVQGVVTEAFNGDADNTIVISLAAVGATAMCSSIVVDKDAATAGNWVSAAFGAMPVTGGNEVVASGGDVYAYRAANTNASTGKMYFVLTFMKTA